MNNHDFDWNGNAVQLARAITETLDDEKRGYASEAAAMVVAGLRSICDSDEVSVRVAATVTRLMAVILETPLMQSADQVDNTLVAYAMAAGNLTGGFDLPEAHSRPADDVPDFFPSEWKRYLN